MCLAMTWLHWRPSDEDVAELQRRLQRLADKLSLEDARRFEHRCANCTRVNDRFQVQQGMLVIQWKGMSADGYSYVVETCLQALLHHAPPGRHHAE